MRTIEIRRKQGEHHIDIVESVNAIVIIPPEHDVNPAVAIVNPGFGVLPDTEAQRTVVYCYRTVAERSAADS